MKINNISSNTYFRGYLDKSIERYIGKQISGMLGDKIDSARKEKREITIKEIDEVANKASEVAAKLEEKASEMHPSTCLYIDKGASGDYSFVKVKNKNLKSAFTRANDMYPVTYPINKENAQFTLKYWPCINESKISPEERMDRLKEIADSINPKETDRKLVRKSMQELMRVCKNETARNCPPASKHMQNKMRKAAEQIASIQSEIGYTDARKDIGIKHNLPKEIEKMFARQKCFSKLK